MSETAQPRLAYDICRCLGDGCHQKDECLRHTDKGEKGHLVPFALSLHRTGAKECSSFIFNEEGVE